jgi:hypothetical protein
VRNHFTDDSGVRWMILPGLPDAHPGAHETDALGAFTGFTFQASHGELRIVTRDVIRDAWSVRKAERIEASAWESLLARATPWPLA